MIDYAGQYGVPDLYKPSGPKPGQKPPGPRPQQVSSILPTSTNPPPQPPKIPFTAKPAGPKPL
jgi:hypothetical protein